MTFWDIFSSLSFYNSMKESYQRKEEKRESMCSWLEPGRFAHVFMITIFYLRHMLSLSLIGKNYTSLPLPFLLSFFAPPLLLLFCFTSILAIKTCHQKLNGALQKQIPEAPLLFVRTEQSLCWRAASNLALARVSINMRWEQWISPQPGPSSCHIPHHPMRYSAITILGLSHDKGWKRMQQSARPALLTQGLLIMSPALEVVMWLCKPPASQVSSDLFL